MKQILITILVLSTLNTLSYSQIIVSKYEKAMKVDANNVPDPDVIFTSSCGEVTVDITEKMASGGCLGNIIRTYTATDECGNTASAEQYLSLQDSQGPEIYGVPEDIHLDSKNIPEAPIVGAKDIGDQMIEVITSEERKGNLIIRTFKATDKCGNTSEKSYTIHVNGK